MKKTLWILFSILLCGLLTGCGGIVQPGSQPDYSGMPSAASNAETSAPVSAESVTTASAPLRSAGLDYTSTGTVNPLTGQSNLSPQLQGYRSLSVVINNYKAALPQNGINRAELVFECEAEGGITRLLAFYSDWKNLPKTGSIREARKYFLDIAQSLDSLMLYYGADADTNTAVSTAKYSVLNAMRYPSLTYRDEELRKTRAAEHTVVTTAELVQKQIAAGNVRTNLLPTAPKTVFSFSSAAEPLTFTQYRAKTVYLPVGGNAEYRYDSANGLYNRYAFGTPQTDLNDGQQVSVTNVIVLFAKQYPNPADATLNCIDLTGSAGEGYYFTMGTGQKLFWQKGPNDTDPIILYDAKGNVMTLNQGKSWVNILPNTLSDKVTWSEIAS